ncbi:MAG: hypothetical protein ACD_31C00008G0013 [uncultured bacterium]|uniref:tRNA threonylcarbamoyladenosine biosynthesis protein TsaE n=3 Tax=Candidatus Daviesiibacteriota TaxID=1752718 RepID=A0A0G0EVU7_9BACT|nr:MAG: hypothetical protein ACD_31C00008G0013 [uncultured bacterium]KKQ09602.1 MAG: hypothetical protein US19_C0012G0036 [Candidatus Daviesbacteria bacterium GW2011_GWB1_36_5]KKQ16422.1 MAG: hypothetical protein US28_C0001G0012 [Candidatus Daviesbacteria bacterium GW2011_GWA1_36_8]OGE17755.1 MAG: tRNA (adenosine(37)-N6)-threonylcarbamoyltransferase complex ATPase subunit type 1 TsaE [Candidatus Daviesbacteria bacterium RIFCSPHIGHO2_01_FULL_36_37]
MIKNKQGQLVSTSPKQTQEFAAKIAKDSKNTGRIFALIGDLGSGKTTFAQGFARGLGIKEKIISPTFVLIKQHSIPNSKKTFYHIDLYRLEGEIDLISIGLKEIFESGNVVLIEWADKILDMLPKDITKIIITKLDKDERSIEIT